MIRGSRSSKNRGMTLIEIMIVIFIFGILLMIAIPAWMRQREQARSRACQENLTQIDGAKEIFALENNYPQGSDVEMADLIGPMTGYIKKEPSCPSGGEYIVQPIGIVPSCTYSGQELFNIPPHALPVVR